MGSDIRVFEIAKEYDISSEKVISILKGQGVDVKSKISEIDEKSLTKVIDIIEKQAEKNDGEIRAENYNSPSDVFLIKETPKSFRSTPSKEMPHVRTQPTENGAEGPLPKISLISNSRSVESSPKEPTPSVSGNREYRSAERELLGEKSPIQADGEPGLTGARGGLGPEIKSPPDSPASTSLKEPLNLEAKSTEIPKISLANIRPTGESSHENPVGLMTQEKGGGTKKSADTSTPELSSASSAGENLNSDQENIGKNSSSHEDSQTNLLFSLDEVYQAVVDQKRQEKIRREFKEDRVVTIKVDQVVSKLSLLYEKLRNTLDYQDQHLMFRNAIYRILARLFREQAGLEFDPELTKKKEKKASQGKGTNDSKSLAASAGPSSFSYLQPEALSKTLIIELIRAGYLGNQQVLESKIEEIALVIKRFLSLEHFIKRENSSRDSQELSCLREWLIHLAATNIAENIERDDRNYLTASFSGTTSWSVKTSETITKHLANLVGNHIHENKDDKKYTLDRTLQIYVSIHRKLFNYNRQMIEFSVFRHFYPNWDEINSEKELIEIAKEYSAIRSAIEYQANHPFYRKIQKITSRYAICFSILRDSFQENPDTTLSQIKKRPNEFKKSVESICEKRYLESQKDLFANALKCVAYVLLTKIGLVMLLELPLTHLFSPDMPANLKHFTVAINISFPPLLLALIALFTTIPHRENTNSIFSGLEEILYRKKSDIQLIKLNYPVNEKKSMNLFFGSFLVFTTVTFSAIAAALFYIGFNWISIGIFLFFLAIINFLGFNLQKIAKRYQVCESNPTVFSFIANQFYIPVIAMGKWLSDFFSENNIFILILDKTIEGPFAKFVNAVEGWSNYLKAKKEDSLEH